MSEKDVVEQKPLQNFLVRCKVEDLDGNRQTEIMDMIAAEDIQDAKNYITGWLAVREFKVKRWDLISNADQLRKMIRAISR